jgi:hypothetical protein
MLIRMRWACGLWNEDIGSNRPLIGRRQKRHGARLVGQRDLWRARFIPRNPASTVPASDINPSPYMPGADGGGQPAPPKALAPAPPNTPFRKKKELGRKPSSNRQEYLTPPITKASAVFHIAQMRTRRRCAAILRARAEGALARQSWATEDHRVIRAGLVEAEQADRPCPSNPTV